jgi:predicted TIM-barrel fold metal-dependent hydrolase
MTVSESDLWIVSVDDHIVEPQTLWTDRLPARHLAEAPRVTRERALAEPATTAEGRDVDILQVGPDDAWAWCDVWRFNGEAVPMTRGVASAGFDAGETDLVPVTYDELRPGCFDAAARLEDMDLDGIEASLCFPNMFVQFCGQRFARVEDRELGLLCVQAYNDFLVDEWAAPSDGRLQGAAILPLWDVALSVEEVQRVAAMGCRAVCFSEVPAWLGLPSMYSGEWDPLFAACADAEVVICIHVGSSSRIMTTSSDAPRSVGVINFSSNTALSLTDWLMCGALTRFPSLRIAFSEGQAGWVPYLVNRMDVMWREKKAYHGVDHLPEPPSSYLRNFSFCIFDDVVGLAHLDLLGEDNVCYETDYPHPDGTFPHSRRVALENTASLEPAQREKVLRTNAIRLFGFDR